MAKGKGKGHRHHQAKKSSAVLVVLAVLLLLTVMLLVLLGLGVVSIPIGRDDDFFTIGDGLKLKRLRLESIRIGEEGSEEGGERWTEILSWRPRAFRYHNFLSKKECEHLINLAKPHMEKSKVVDSETGESVDSKVRTSSGMFLARGQDEIITRIERRIADFTFLPEENGEGLQVLYYEVGQKYEPHFDYFVDDFNIKKGGQRIATLLMYLSDVEEGGETVFPAVGGNFSFLTRNNQLSECAKNGLSVKPQRGDALLFWSLSPEATVDPSSAHGSCPVIKGNKWSATKWIHVHKYSVES
ncbi:probable prolyl 4-hydroxylase 3 [Andrographis paniculata]|uniref:probable prolyl 4-hydroxylase 3 n=1 Tax=Andrographis paniculata TaxID=175694 RepID=UPI0021E9602A|nr:probable prolyl 4-hydroxylase 3 [Andrographis paniculata]